MNFSDAYQRSYDTLKNATGYYDFIIIIFFYLFLKPFLILKSCSSEIDNHI